MKRAIFAICTYVSIFLMSCQHKELCYHHPHEATVRVEFDWRNAPNATPEGMTVYFYPEEGGLPQRSDFIGKNGGIVDLVVGKYKVICYNNDTEAVLFRDINQFDKHAAYTRDGNIFESIYGNATQYAPRADNTEDERVVISPDMMWGCSVYDLEITESGLSYICVPEKDKDDINVQNKEHVITLYPCEIVCTYTYEVRNVSNLKYVTQICGSLSSMAPSQLFANEQLAKECVTIPFASTSDGISKITGQFYTFGHHEDNQEKHMMLFYAWLEDGAKYYYTYDVTDQIHEAPDKRHVHIIIDGLEFPQPIGNGSGFDVDVDDWTIVEEDILM